MGIQAKVTLRYLYVAMALAFMVSMLVGMVAKADPLGSVTEYNVPTPQADPTSIVEGADGAMWFIESSVRKIGKMTKAGVFTEYPVSSSHNPSVSLNGSLVRGSDSRLWFADIASDEKGQLKAISTDGEITTYTPDTGFSHIGALTAGPNNEIWFSGGGVDNNGVATSHIRSVTTDGTLTPRHVQLSGIVTALAPDYSTNSMWYARKDIALPGSGPQDIQTVIGKVNANGTTTEYTAGTSSQLYFITQGVDGNLWYTDGSNVGVVSADLMNSETYRISNLNVALRGIAAGPDGHMWAAMPNTNRVVRISVTGATTEYAIPDGTGGPFWMTKASDGNMWFTEPGGANQIGKVGTGAPNDPDPEQADSDNDQLTADREALQHTSDHNWDTDNDGLSDYVESDWYDKKVAVFCKDNSATACEYPEPLIQDIYVEVDWMDHPGYFYGWGSYSMKLTDAQTAPIKAAFTRKGIRLHIDNGQLGGGNKITYKDIIKFDADSNAVDFYDYKLGGNGITAQFSPLRRQIFHYAIMGDRYREYDNTTSNSGIGRISDDDMFVAYSVVKDTIWSYPSPTFDKAIAGTFMHELGHNLCLTNSATPEPYIDFPQSCVYDGVDNKNYFIQPYSKYFSSMNYSKQKTIVDYSSGVNGSPNDHDDWSAIRPADFAYSSRGDLNH